MPNRYIDLETAGKILLGALRVFREVPMTSLSSVDRLDIVKNHICQGPNHKNSPHQITMSGSGVQPPLTTHILDTALGKPASQVPMVLSIREQNGTWKQIETNSTNIDGRGGFLSQSSFRPAVYKLHFDTGYYFTKNNLKGFYPYVEVVFQIEDENQHYHVPLLLSPYGYSTYRGS